MSSMRKPWSSFQHGAKETPQLPNTTVVTCTLAGVSAATDGVSSFLIVMCPSATSRMISFMLLSSAAS